MNLNLLSLLPAGAIEQLDVFWNGAEVAGTSVGEMVWLAVVCSVPWFALHVVARALVRWATPYFASLRGLDGKAHAAVHSYIVSAVHAVVATCLAGHTLATTFADGPFGRAVELPLSDAVRGTAALSAGYFVYDLWSIWLSIPHLLQLDTVMHHTQWLWAAAVCCRHGLGPILMWSLTLEASTPFVNGIFLGKAFGVPRAVEVANGAMLVLVFGGRIFPWLPFCAHHLYANWDVLWVDAAWSVRTLSSVNLVAGTVLNVMWYAKIVRGFAKAVRK